jgi:hypothetical protein
MRKTTRAESWVVYQRTMTHHRKTFVTNAVCDQSEWHALEKAEPGVHTLIQGRIGTEEEAEKLARGTSGDDYRSRKKAIA